ncbi:hypothetical protein ILUMI_18138 [Ignelater luminosus]|uniref:Uncharacterized protein n=1 Tax=Ignelater luminosus TaxID=2038154 RepID=A0A8K0CIV5_IGNLU|nr:hypothetical protein ILUMI_18138 [Ignelater luminosus]
MLKEVEQMEKALNKKEEEINMVMSLYTEVLALKDQVKRLRERTHSQASIILSKNPSKATDYKEPKATDCPDFLVMSLRFFTTQRNQPQPSSQHSTDALPPQNFAFTFQKSYFGTGSTRVDLVGSKCLSWFCASSATTST